MKVRARARMNAGLVRATADCVGDVEQVRVFGFVKVVL